MLTVYLTLNREMSSNIKTSLLFFLDSFFTFFLSLLFKRNNVVFLRRKRPITLEEIVTKFEKL